MNQFQPDNAPLLLDRLAAEGASDIQFKTGQPPLIALHGSWLRQDDFEPLTAQDVEAIHLKLCRDERYQTIPDRGAWDADYRTMTNVNNFRVSGGKEHGRPYLVLRPLPRRVPNFETIRALDDHIDAPEKTGHIHDAFRHVMRQKRGLVLVTGPTGSGKSTTLAALVNHANQTYRHNIITIEDPIEFVFRSEQSQILQREVGVDTETFASGLRGSLRQKPDIILVGEMRDAETMDAAFRAAATGHLVLSTLHNNEAAQTVERIINEFPSDQQQRVQHTLAEVLVGIFAQQLVPTTTGGRQVIHEVMVMTQTLRVKLRQKDGYLQGIRDELRTRSPLGNRTMDGELLRAREAGIVTDETAQEFAIQPEEFGKRVGA